MVTLVSNEDVREGLADATIIVDDENVLSTFKRLCIEYDIPADEMGFKWMSFCSKNPKVDRTAPNDVGFELFEKNVLKKERAGKLQGGAK